MILDDITAAVYKRLADDMEKTSLSEMKKAAENMSPLKKKTFKEALRKSGMSFICEVKKASPSKGTIVDDFPYIEIAQEYEAAGADAVSVLTERDYFKGGPERLVGICIDKGYKFPLNQCFKAYLFFIFNSLKCLGIDNKSNLYSPRKVICSQLIGDTCFIYLVTSGSILTR